MQEIGRFATEHGVDGGGGQGLQQQAQQGCQEGTGKEVKAACGGGVEGGDRHVLC